MAKMNADERRHLVSGIIFMILGTLGVLAGGWFFIIQPIILEVDGAISMLHFLAKELLGIEVLFTSVFGAYMGYFFVFDKEMQTLK